MSNEEMIIKVITEEAKERSANIISLFEITSTNNKYAIYTFNEEDAQGLVKIYASKLVFEDKEYSFQSIKDIDEWAKVKEMMKDMAKETSNNIKNGVVKLISIDEIKAQTNEPLSVKLSETKAAKIGQNYKVGISNNYVNNVPKYEPKIEVKATESVIPNIPNSLINNEDTTSVVPEPVAPSIPEEPVAPVVPEPVAPSIPEEPVAPVIPEPVAPSIPEEPVAPVTPEPAAPSIPEEPIFVQKKYEEPEIKKQEVSEPSFFMKKEEKEEVKNMENDSFNPIKYEKDLPNVDSILNKASSSYYTDEEDEEQNLAKENIIQTIGLEFMRKVSELAEYEKDLKRREKEIEMRERGLIRVEKEILSKENKYKDIVSAIKTKDAELKSRERELNDKETELTKKVSEFNKKITMFQQSFGLVSGVE